MWHQQVTLDVDIPFEGFRLNGELIVPAQALGVVLFAHGSGSSRLSPRNQFVAGTLQEHRIGTLLFDLLTEKEEEEDRVTAHLRFNITFLAERLLGATRWYHQKQPDMLLGYFGSSTGAGAALVAAAQSTIVISAIVSRGGRPDLAGTALAGVKAPTLLVVGEGDPTVLQLNRQARAMMQSPNDLRLVRGATHLFEEPGALEQVAELAAEWFERHFKAA